MTNISAMDGPLPELMDQFLGCEISPGGRDVTIVAALVDDDRLAVLLAPDSCLPHLQPSRGLDAQVRHPRLGVVIKLSPVEDRAEVLVEALSHFP